MSKPIPIQPTTFAELALPPFLLAALDAVGYETPSPIQARTIPPLLAGHDLLGQAQTGTGKTAAFALPILARIDVARPITQALVLTPTRELAIQVAEAFQKYGAQLAGFHVLPVYGGAPFGPQLHALRRGAHVVVGTPGRVIDHMERGTLKLDGLATLVLDEADEMLRMGFIDDVEKILKETPPTRQVALFSATMPPRIARIAQTYLRSPEKVTIQSKTSTVADTRQRFWMAGGSVDKLDALTRILEAEPFDGLLVFVRTRVETSELAGRLEARGFAAAPLSGDIEQRERERTVNRLKTGELDILVATDVAARGLDVDRISHVVNFDVPTDTESYVHRIGRTGRAGRKGEAILFVTPRERHMLRIIERATRAVIEPMELPSIEAVNLFRLSKLDARAREILADPALAAGLAPFREMVERARDATQATPGDLAAAFAYMAQGETPLMSAKDLPREPSAAKAKRPGKPASRPDEHGTLRPPAYRPHGAREAGLETFRIEVGHQHGVKPANIVGAIANEADLSGKDIGRIEIFDDHSLVDLPEGMPREVFRKLQATRVAGQMLAIRPADAARPSFTKPFAPRSRKPFAPRPAKPGQKPFQKRPRAHEPRAD